MSDQKDRLLPSGDGLEVFQDEGQPDRDYLGIDGTAGDAQDVPHPFIASVHGAYCRVCGLAQSYRKHVEVPK